MIAFARSIAGRVFLYLVAGISASVILNTALALWRVHHPFIFLAFVIAMLALSYAVARIVTRPLSDLASAAERLERDLDSLPIPERGPTEVRLASAAFNAMQQRIARDVRERTYMLAAITHDLQTPVTRLRLRLEKVSEEGLRAKLVADLDAMRATIREGLDLATSLDTREPLQPIDLDSMLESVVADAVDTGHDVTLSGSTHAFVLGVPNGLRRCMTNLLDNAIAYGRCARVECETRGARAIVRVRDGGPGIPVERLREVLDPFVRLETSRSRETGGTGIGLTIARNVVGRMGGTLVLRNHPEGGLEVRVDFPADRSIKD